MKFFFGTLISVALLAPQATWADCVSGSHSATGFATPTSMTMTFTQVRLVKTDNTSLTLFSGTTDQTFNRADSNFSALTNSGSTILVPEGRYAEAQICYNTSRSVVLNNVTYQGANGTKFNNAAGIWSVTAGGACDTDVVNDADPGTATTLTGFVVGSGSNNCSSSYFRSPICVSPGGSGCESTDIVVDPASTTPNIVVMLDMYHSVGVDANNGSLDNHIPVYPYATIGFPGAAIHMRANSGTNYNNLSMLFARDGSMLYAASFGQHGSACNGNGFVSVTSAPAGAYVNAYGPTAVMTSDATAGTASFVAGGCSGSTCTSSGLNVITNWKQAVTNTTNVTCSADTTGSLGYTYTGGAGGGTVSYTIARVVDPSNIFGICTSSFISGSTGSCAATGGDGYP